MLNRFKTIGLNHWLNRWLVVWAKPLEALKEIDGRERKKRTVKDNFQDSILVKDDEVRSTKDRRS